MSIPNSTPYLIDYIVHFNLEKTLILGGYSDISTLVYYGKNVVYAFCLLCNVKYRLIDTKGEKMDEKNATGREIFNI